MDERVKKFDEFFSTLQRGEVIVWNDGAETDYIIIYNGKYKVIDNSIYCEDDHDCLVDIELSGSLLSIGIRTRTFCFVPIRFMGIFPYRNPRVCTLSSLEEVDG